MKRALLINLLLAVVLATTGSVGCRKKPKSPTPIPRLGAGDRSGTGTFGPEEVSVVPGGPSVTGTPVVGDDSGGMQGLPDDSELPNYLRDESIFASQTVYFDFDRSSIRPGERSKIEAVASHLRSNPSHKLRVEGHCDERGTEGYNLSLGDRRALSVREYLLNLGIGADRIFTTSYGESKPVDPRQTEEAYARNRRAEFVLLLPKS